VSSLCGVTRKLATVAGRFARDWRGDRKRRGLGASGASFAAGVSQPTWDDQDAPRSGDCELGIGSGGVAGGGGDLDKLGTGEEKRFHKEFRRCGRRQKVTQQAKSSAIDETAPGDETLLASNDSEDFTLLPGDVPGMSEDGTVVQVRMQRGALGALGLAVNEESATDWIQVDLLVSEDGQPEAVRLPQTSGN
jgi:hypothetical protein